MLFEFVVWPVSTGEGFRLGKVMLKVGILVACVSSFKFPKSGVEVQDAGRRKKKLVVSVVSTFLSFSSLAVFDEDVQLRLLISLLESSLLKSTNALDNF